MQLRSSRVDQKAHSRDPQKCHEDHAAERGSFNSSSQYNLVHKLMLMHQAMIIPDGTAAVDKEWDKLIKVIRAHKR